MAETCFPLENTLYTAEDAQLWLATRTSGVYAGSHLGVTANDTMEVSLGSGIAWLHYDEFAGCVYGNKSALALAVEMSDGEYNRIDRVCIRLEMLNNKCYAYIKKGTAAENPVPPELQRDNVAYEISVAQIFVGAGIIAINAGNITDERLDETVCGLMRDGVTGVDTSVMQAQFASMLDTFTTVYQAEFEQWFAQLQNTLSDNVAGNLASLIALRPVCKTHRVEVPVDGWTEENDKYFVWVSVEGVKANDTKCDIDVSYVPDHSEAYAACELEAIAQDEGRLKLRVSQIPEEAFPIYVRVMIVGTLGESDEEHAVPGVIDDSVSSEISTYSSAKMETVFIKNASGTVKRDNIADGAINNAKLNFEAVSNAKIMPGTIQKDRLHADALAYLTGSQYMRISYDGSSRLDVHQGNHMYALRLINKPEIHLQTMLINHAYFNGEFLFNGMDIEGPMKLAGRSDFIGGIHGDEQMNDYRIIADGVDITETACELDSVKTLVVYIESSVYDMDSTDALFSRIKVLSFSGNKLKVFNRWDYSREEPILVERWPGCGLYSVFKENSLGYTSNKEPRIIKGPFGYNQDLYEVSFWVSGTMVTVKPLTGMDSGHYYGGVEEVSGDRLKVYFDTIHSSEGVKVQNFETLEASFVITVGEVV